MTWFDLNLHDLAWLDSFRSCCVLEALGKIGTSLGKAQGGGNMVPRGRVSDDVSYVLLETPLVPRLDLSDCRPTELPVLPETTPTQLSDHAPQGNGGKGALGQASTGGEMELVPVLPRGPPVTGV